MLQLNNTNCMRSFILKIKELGTAKTASLVLAILLIGIAGYLLITSSSDFSQSFQSKFDSGSYGDTIPEVEKRLRLNPNDSNAKELLAALYIQAADAEPQNMIEYTDKAIVLLNELILSDKNRTEAYRLLGTAYVYRFEIKSAEKNFRKAVGLSGESNLNARAGLIGIYELRGDWNAVSAGYGTILQKDKDNVMANLGMGRYFVQQNRTSEARARAQKVLDISTNRASLGEAYHIIGSSLKLDGDVEGAIKYLNESLKYRPSNVHTIVILGETYLDKLLITRGANKNETIDIVRDLANKVISIKPDYIYAYTLLYKTYIIKGEFSDANTLGKKIVEMLPSDKLLTESQRKEFKEYYSGDITSITVKSVTSKKVDPSQENKSTVPKPNTGVINNIKK